MNGQNILCEMCLECLCVSVYRGGRGWEKTKEGANESNNWKFTLRASFRGVGGVPFFLPLPLGSKQRACCTQFSGFSYQVVSYVFLWKQCDLHVSLMKIKASILWLLNYLILFEHIISMLIKCSWLFFFLVLFLAMF